MNIFQGKIKARVMKQINARIEKAEKDHLDECAKIDKEAELLKIKSADKHVDAILGKIL